MRGVHRDFGEKAKAVFAGNELFRREFPKSPDFLRWKSARPNPPGSFFGVLYEFALP